MVKSCVFAAMSSAGFFGASLRRGKNKRRPSMSKLIMTLEETSVRKTEVSLNILYWNDGCWQIEKQEKYV